MIATPTTVDNTQQAEKAQDANLDGSDRFAGKEMDGGTNNNNNNDGDGDGDINIIFRPPQKIEASRFSRPKGPDTIESLVIL